MALVVACLVVLAFVVACHASRVGPVARRVLKVARQSTAAMRDPALDDEAKEQAAREAAIALLRDFLSITFRSLIALAASAAVIYAADLLGFVPAQESIDVLERWEFIVAATILLTATYLVVARRFPSASQR